MGEVAVIKPEITVDDLTKEMLTMEQADCPVIHHFSPGLYIRELHMKAGIFAVGHYQKTEHFNMFLKGKILTKDDDGNNIEISAPMTYTAKPGKKFGYILEDVVWLNIYATDEMDVETLERIYLDKYENTTWIEAEKLWYREEKQKRIEDNKSYEQLLIEYGFTEEIVKKQTEDIEDQIPLLFGEYKVFVSKSAIHGKGIFASANIGIGETIGIARLGDKRTPLGRYTNHSQKPNAKMETRTDGIYLVATTDIKGCIGGFNGEEITTDYKKNLKLIGVNKCQE